MTIIHIIILFVIHYKIISHNIIVIVMIVISTGNYGEIVSSFKYYAWF